MSLIDITTKGRIRLTLNGVELSQHVVETEAIEKALAHAAAHGDATYVLKYPEKHVRVIGTQADPAGGDTERPTDVGMLTQTGLGATFVSFSWGAASDNIGVAGYQVFDDDVPLGTTTSTSYTANNLTPSTPHSFTVKAYDDAGNVSLNMSPPLVVTTNANAAPSWNTAQQELTTNQAYSLLLTSICSDADSNPITFSVVSGTLPAGLTFNATTKQVSGTPTAVETQAVTFRASDGITSTDASITFRVLNADTTAPTTVSQPTAGSVGANSASLSWTAVSDQVVANARTSGLGGYRVYRDGGLRQDVGNTTSFTDTGLSASTSYSYTVRAYDLASPANVSPDSTARVVTTSATASTLDQDWINRSTAVGVIWATNFASAAEVNNWRYTNQNSAEWDPNSLQSQSTLLQYRAGEGYNFAGALRIEDTSNQNNPVVWWRTLDASKTSGSRDVTYLVPAGTNVYVQARLKINSIRMRNDTGNGLKMIEITSAFNTNVAQEFFLARYYNQRLVRVQGSTFTQNDGQRWDYTNLPGGDFDLQPGSDYGLCLYSTNPNGCYVLEPDEWYTFHITLRGGTTGNNDTYCKVEVAREFESGYTTVYERADMYTSGYQFGEGYSAVALFNRNEANSGLPAKCYHHYSQVIASTQPIAAPMPRYTVPSWFTAASNYAWGSIPGTAGTLRTAAEAISGTDARALLYAWTSCVVDQDRKAVVLPNAGGHGDYYSRNVFEVPLTGETNAWSSLLPAFSSDNSDTVNGTGANSDGTLTTIHHYSLVEYGGGKVWFPGIPSMAGSTGNPSLAIWSWDRDQRTNATKGYTYHGKAASSMQSAVQPNLYYASHGVYDPVDRNVWGVPFEANGGATAPGAWRVNVDTNAITAYTFGGAFLPAWCVCIPHLRILLAGLEGGTLVRLNLENPSAGWTTCTQTTNGFFRASRGDGAVYHPAANKVYVWGGGAAIRIVNIPSTASGTYVWGSRTITGTIPATPTHPALGGTQIHKKFGLVEQFGQHAMLTLVNTVDNPVYFMKIPAAGL